MIPDHAFSGCAALQDATLPETVTEIKDKAFYCCKNLSTVIFSNNLQTIGVYAFSGCSALEDIEFPSTLTLIDGHAFDGCTGITNIVIPNSVTSIGEGAFQNTSLTSDTEQRNEYRRRSISEYFINKHNTAFCGKVKVSHSRRRTLGLYFWDA